MFYVAAPMHYKPTISWLKEHFDFSEAFSLRSISSSYLPDWRPGVDDRKTYSAHKEGGRGCFDQISIHEWDYLQYLIGFPERAYSIIEKRSGLEIDSDDVALYIAELMGTRRQRFTWTISVEFLYERLRYSLKKIQSNATCSPTQYRF